MSGFKGTPGPWHYEGAEDGGRVLAMDDRQTIVHHPPCNPYNEQVRADARLIAASPRMYSYVESRADAGDEEAKKIIAEVSGA